jgi:hypothetical protein
MVYVRVRVCVCAVAAILKITFWSEMTRNVTENEFRGGHFEKNMVVFFIWNDK